MPKNSRFSRISKFIVLPLIPTGFYSNIARVRKRRRTQRGKDPPSDSDPRSDGEFGKNLACQSSKIDASECSEEFARDTPATSVTDADKPATIASVIWKYFKRRILSLLLSIRP